MKRWVGPLAVGLLGCVLILANRASAPGLLGDTDTKVLLETIRAKNAPFSWFLGDWPLYNHFYRPMPTLFFELDSRLYGNAAWGFGLTNALLCAVCTMLLVWFLRELTDNPALTAAATGLFALWEVDDASWLANPIQLALLIVLVGGVLRHRLRLRLWLPAVLVLCELRVQIGIAQPIGSRTIDWLPGRTALVMTVFALGAMAAYARYERLGAARKVREASPLDPPATKSARVIRSRRGQWLWAAAAVLGTFLAMASYEQGIMVPAALLGTAITFRWRGYRVRWGWQAAFWGALVVYVVFRHAVVPSSASAYQLQQFRTGPGVWTSILDYCLPSLFAAYSSTSWLPDLPLVLLTAEPWQTVLAVAADVATLAKIRTRWVFAASGFGLSLVAYLPMAWLKQFEHYHYWPLALKSLLVATIGWLAWDLSVTALSPQTRQAPPRLDPAPGSLPHP